MVIVVAIPMLVYVCMVMLLNSACTTVGGCREHLKKVQKRNQHFRVKCDINLNIESG